jgi:hypothetical protein
MPLKYKKVMENQVRILQNVIVIEEETITKPKNKFDRK